MAEVCKRYGWTYHQYLDQPQWFLDLIVEKEAIEARRTEAEQKKAGKK
jgi:hypothetical protein